MAKYRPKANIVEATQWFKNGDHPHDRSVVIRTPSSNFLSEGKVIRRYRRSDVSGKDLCPDCDKTYHVHGWFEAHPNGHDEKVCPGDFVVTYEDDMYGPECYYIQNSEEFLDDHELVMENSCTNS